MSREKADKEEKKGFKREALSWVICIVVTILLTEFILNFVIINANIPSGSMENTIMTNDKLIALRTSYWFKDPKRGALPGETVQVKDGKVYINGSSKPLSEPYIKEEPVEDFGPYTVPKNGYFVMGDNRNNSNDAREWDIHYVSRDEILGKAWFRYYPSIKRIK